ncbi:hypothetical protein HB770_21000 [Rhizobium leguminosarum bv. viciae]|uniref:Uncharacterized protein n=1 Tax=Rhizobium leguminosarum bv. viciae TaxID=387 RepID=A0A7G6RL50_RHILV|nr:hypothetical protein HB770_21000 [Rhizobium leguminosarum bv. viciae]
MTILFSSIAALAFASALGKLLKRNADLYFPRCDDEGEIEALLADGLALALAKDAA